MAFTKVCTLQNIPENKGLKVENGEASVAVFKVNGKVFAIQDLCSHGLWSLSEIGYLEGDAVVCPLHMGKFCVHTGKVTSLPPNRPLKKYPALVEGEDVYVAFDEGYIAE
ncbi:non-heme iron oxygenase ferredoxin subunit [Niallia endozanthoxylica]|uniref:Non-heme iron oxygenase ferredoxin subunit n=1 Tax=Niallia endozanthoxylica TaxID=2036016 RepID=A0A5J5I266_9BACI|nr:non-heme iron oxygenase ferredoxin subunit [Niallia endozanthoxylica]KAA9028619.1 non-heme iron oxygenase ferredoxin subunit [Niallia endozanthoxylica]